MNTEHFPFILDDELIIPVGSIKKVRPFGNEVIVSWIDETGEIQDTTVFETFAGFFRRWEQTVKTPISINVHHWQSGTKLFQKENS